MFNEELVGRMILVHIKIEELVQPNTRGLTKQNSNKRKTHNDLSNLELGEMSIYDMLKR
jgi:hypothetical protein